MSKTGCRESPFQYRTAAVLRSHAKADDPEKGVLSWTRLAQLEHAHKLNTGVWVTHSTFLGELPSTSQVGLTRCAFRSGVIRPLTAASGSNRLLTLSGNWIVSISSLSLPLVAVPAATRLLTSTECAKYSGVKK